MAAAQRVHGDTVGPRDDLVRRLEPFPMVEVRHRTLDPDFAGPVFVWDVDKTYLDTRFSQAKGLMRIPFELGVDKRSVPGTATLLRALRAGPSGRDHRPLFFVSASPPQLHRPITGRMVIDGVEFDGITYKDWAALLRRARFDQLKEQVAFKLAALLRLVEALPLGGQLHLFGDDAERDALIYCLLADVTAGRLRGASLRETLADLGVHERSLPALERQAEAVAPREAVAGIYVHLIREPDGASIAEFGPGVAGWPSAAAAAELLRERGLVADGVPSEVRAECPEAEPVAGKAEPDPDGWWTPVGKRSGA